MIPDSCPDYTFEDIVLIFQGDRKKHGRLNSYRIQIDYTERLLYAIHGNRLIDEAVYFAIIPTKGRELKAARERPLALSCIISSLTCNIERWTVELKSYPSSRNAQVYQVSQNPPYYSIAPSYPPAQALARELGMPVAADETYWLQVRPGNTPFTRQKKYQNYSIEEFGLTTKRPTLPKLDPEEVMRLGRPETPKPDPSLYTCRPRYWCFSGEWLVQIWRSRVLACPIKCFRSTVERPFISQYPNVMFFEEIWHPIQGRKRSVGGIEHLHQSAGTHDPNELYRDALRILGYKVRKSRRRYETADELRRDLAAASLRIKVYRAKKGTLENFALELDIDRKTLSNYLNDFSLSLPHPPESPE
jgi:hypothetical protein